MDINQFCSKIKYAENGFIILEDESSAPYSYAVIDIERKEVIAKCIDDLTAEAFVQSRTQSKPTFR